MKYIITAIVACLINGGLIYIANLCLQQIIPTVPLLTFLQCVWAGVALNVIKAFLFGIPTK